MSPTSIQGLDISPEYDLDLQYFRLMPINECQRLCARTPQCRAAVFYSPQAQCALKSATCLEAGLGTGCFWNKGDGSVVLYQKTTSTDFLLSNAFVFYVGVAQQVPWAQAAQHCAALGFELAAVHSRDPLNAIGSAWVQQLTAMDLSADGVQPWIGGSTNADGWFEWADGTLTVFDAFLDGQRRASPGCTAIGPAPAPAEGQYVFTTANCSDGSYFVCKAVPPIRPLLVLWADSTLYTQYDRPLVHQDAMTFCRWQQRYDALGQLEVPFKGGRGTAALRAYTRTEQEIMWDLEKALYHLDGTKNTTRSTDWYWSDGLPVNIAVVQGNTFSQGPDPACLLSDADNDRANPLLVVARGCSEMHDVMCTISQYGDDHYAPTRLLLHQGRAYAFFARPQPYRLAEAYCRALGGTMASVHDDATNGLLAQTWIEKLGNETADGRSRPLGWLGAASNDSASDAQWADGSLWDFQPEGTDAAALRRGQGGACLLQSLLPSGAVTWERLEAAGGACSDTPLNYTCSLPREDALRPSALWTDGRNGDVYEFFFNAPLNHYDARAVCQARGGDLASVPDAHVFDGLTLLYSQLQTEVWAGRNLMQGLSGDFLLGGVAIGGGRFWADQWRWVDGAPYTFKQWDTLRGPELTMSYPLYPDDVADLCLGVHALIGQAVMYSLRCNHTWPFVCKAPASAPIGSAAQAQAQAQGVKQFRSFGLPRAATYFQAQQLCLAQGGSLATPSTLQEAQAVAQLCANATAALPADSAASSRSACWVGYYCPGGNETKARTGFGYSDAMATAVLQPLLLRPADCSAPDRFLGLGLIGGGVNATAGAFPGAAQLGALAQAAPAGGPACASLQLDDAGGPSLQLVRCMETAVYVCEFAPPQPPASFRQPPAASDAQQAAGTTAAGGSYSFDGCYANSLENASSSSGSGGSGSSGSTPPRYLWPAGSLPLLLALNATSLDACYSLALSQGATHFALAADSGACSAAVSRPGLPYWQVPDPADCYRPCAPAGQPGAGAGMAPGCGINGRIAVYGIDQPPPQQADPEADTGTSMPAGAPRYLCMQGYMLAGRVVGRLPMSASELPACRELCDKLPACHAYTWDRQVGHCLLVDSGTSALADAHLALAAWAGDTCVKVTRIVPGASLKQLGSNGDWYACADSATTSSNSPAGLLLEGLPGDEVLSTRNRLPVQGAAGCADACRLNVTCTAFALAPGPDGSGSSGNATCYTRGGIAYAADATALPHRWLELSPLPRPRSPRDAGVQPQLVCMPLRRLALPPQFVCTPQFDASGTVIANLAGATEQSCRKACRALPLCSLFVLSSSGECSLRNRAFYVQPAGRVGSNARSNLVAMTCVHAMRILPRYVDPEFALSPYMALYGPDQNYHACFPYIDVGGTDLFDTPSYDPELCLSACYERPECSYSIMTVDSLTGFCYHKNRPTAYTYNSSQGVTRLDLVAMRETCFNLHRLVPLLPPEWACAPRYALPMGPLPGQSAPQLLRLSADDCEAACASDAACAAYTWAEEGPSCVLGVSPFVGGAGPVGPSPLVNQTCVYMPRLMPGGAQRQANSAWHYCNTTQLPAGFFKGAALLGVARVQQPQRWLWECSAACRAHARCQLFAGLAGQDQPAANSTITRCALYAYRQQAGDGSSSSSSAGPITSLGLPVSQACIMMDAPSLFRATSAGLASPAAAAPLVVVYRSRQYSLYRSSLLTYDQAAAACQALGPGSQLASIATADELAVVRGWLLQPAAAEGAPQLQPAADEPLQPAAYWFGLLPNGSYSYGRPADAAFLAQALPLPVGADTNSSCLALGGNGVVAGRCATWRLPYMCETLIASAATSPNATSGGSSGGNGTSAPPLQVLPACEQGLEEARQLAAASGSVVASLDLSTYAPLARRLLQQAPVTAQYVIGSLDDAAAACGGSAAGCWTQLAARPTQCADPASALATSALCTLSGAGGGPPSGLLVGGPAPSADEAALADALQASGSGAVCVQALPQQTDGGGSYSFGALPCSRSAPALTFLVDPDAPLRAATNNGTLPSGPPGVPPPVLHVPAPPPSSSPVLGPAPTPSSSPQAQTPPQSSPPVLPIPTPFPPASSPTASPLAAPPVQGDDGGDDGLSGGSIAGIVIGSVVGGLLLVALLVWLLVASRKRKQRQAEDEELAKAKLPGHGKEAAAPTKPPTADSTSETTAATPAAPVSAQSNNGAGSEGVHEPEVTALLPSGLRVPQGMQGAAPLGASSSSRASGQAGGGGLGLPPHFNSLGLLAAGSAPNSTDAERARAMAQTIAHSSRAPLAPSSASASTAASSAQAQAQASAPPSLGGGSSIRQQAQGAPSGSAAAAGSSSNGGPPANTPLGPAALASGSSAQPHQASTPLTSNGHVTGSSSSQGVAVAAAAAASSSEASSSSEPSTGIPRKGAQLPAAAKRMDERVQGLLGQVLITGMGVEGAGGGGEQDVEELPWDLDLQRDVQYSREDLLGSGTFGVVYRGTYRGAPVAVKVANRGPQRTDEGDSLASLRQEARVLARVRHPNIVRCYGGCISNDHVFLVEDLMDATLTQLIVAHPGPLPLLTVLKVAVDIAAGLFRLHPTIVHRDLKPDNVLLSRDGVAKISDFGLARFKLDSHMASTKTLAAGTITYMAPECFSGQMSSVTEKADIYSLAVVLWVMVTRDVPWRGYHYVAIVYKVSIKGERLPIPNDPSICPPKLAKLIGAMWEQDPARRPAAGDVLKALSVMLMAEQQAQGVVAGHGGAAVAQAMADMQQEGMAPAGAGGLRAVHVDAAEAQARG